jgi:hypothetical protein
VGERRGGRRLARLARLPRRQMQAVLAGFEPGMFDVELKMGRA